MYIITSPIPYTNGRPHLGHLLEGIFNDTIARFRRRVGDGQVLLTMGLDQHGLKIYQAAQQADIDTELYVEQAGLTFLELWEKYAVRYDAWVPTSSPEHKIVCGIFWKKLLQAGFIYKKQYEGLYNMYDEAFVMEKDLDTNGDLPGRPGVKPILMQEENYFFKLSAFQAKIESYLEHVPVNPEEARTEMLSFAREGLQDISISRERSKMPWGVGVPGDESQVMYVWFDAVINYATACVNLETIERWQENIELRPVIEEELFGEISEAFPIDVVYMGKDIAKFHFIFWPAMLMGVGLPPPLSFVRHGMITDKEGRKFSKSLGNGVEPAELEALFGVEGTRFLILHEVNVAGDTHFDRQHFIDSYHAHLANNIGNLLMRVTTLIATHFEGELHLEDAKPLYDMSGIYSCLQVSDVRGALDEILMAARVGNETLEREQPWKMIKAGDGESARRVMTDLAGLLRDIGSNLSIFMPETGNTIYEAITADKITKAPVLFAKIEEGR
jgi:methionyl-tRNA synthetase